MVLCFSVVATGSVLEDDGAGGGGFGGDANTSAAVGFLGAGCKSTFLRRGVLLFGDDRVSFGAGVLVGGDGVGDVEYPRRR